MFFALCFASCKSVQYLPAEKTTETITEIKEVVRDTVIYIPADESTAQALLECDSAGKILVKEMAILEGKLHAKAKIIVKDNVVMAECQCDSVNIYLQLRDRYQTTAINTVEIVPQLIEKELTWMQKALIGLGAFYLVVIVIGTFLIIRKKIV
jgi:hypothetical protein